MREQLGEYGAWCMRACACACAAHVHTMREMFRTPSCVANVWMLYLRSPSTSGKSCVCTRARACMTHQPRAQLFVAASAHARARNAQTALTQHTRTFVIAMTVAKSVTKQVMNVMAGLHCRRGARGSARAPGQRGLPGQRCPR